MWGSDVDRRDGPVLQCYCSTQTRANPGKRTNHGNLAGGHLHLSGRPRTLVCNYNTSFAEKHLCMLHLSGTPMLLACELGRASMVIASRVRVDTAGRGQLPHFDFPYLALCQDTTTGTRRLISKAICTTQGQTAIPDHAKKPIDPLNVYQA